MNHAATRERGVSATTTHVIGRLSDAMKHRTPTIATIPVKNCENPVKSPSEKRSASVTIRLDVSPYGFPSRYPSGNFCNRRNASTRISRATPNATRLFKDVITNCATPATNAHVASARQSALSPMKSTSPGPTILSTARPITRGA